MKAWFLKKQSNPLIEMESEELREQWIEKKKKNGRVFDREYGDRDCKHKFWGHATFFESIGICDLKAYGLFICHDCGRAEVKNMDDMERAT